MFKLTIGVISAFTLCGCNLSAPPPESSGPSTSTSVSQSLLHTWVNCARRSYQINEKAMADKNEAAERSMAACRSEEDDFRSTTYEVLFPHMKEAVKEVLIGHEAF